MKPFHIACGSKKIEIRPIPRKGQMHFCGHCQKYIESHEVVRTDRRLSTTVTFEGKAYVYGKECR